MDIANREDQLRVLSALARLYPAVASPETLAAELACSEEQLQRMLNLLIEHELVEGEDASFAEHLFTHWDCLRITAAGLSHANADGGLGAQLKRITVDFDEDALRALMHGRVDASSLPAEEKSRLRQAITMAGQEALKTTTRALVEVALQRWPEALQLMQTLPG